MAWARAAGAAAKPEREQANTIRTSTRRLGITLLPSLQPRLFLPVWQPKLRDDWRPRARMESRAVPAALRSSGAPELGPSRRDRAATVLRGYAGMSVSGEVAAARGA